SLPTTAGGRRRFFGRGGRTGLGAGGRRGRPAHRRGAGPLFQSELHRGAHGAVGLGEAVEAHGGAGGHVARLAGRHCDLATRVAQLDLAGRGDAPVADLAAGTVRRGGDRQAIRKRLELEGQGRLTLGGGDLLAGCRVAFGVHGHRDFLPDG